MTITQITATSSTVYGLGSDGKLYYFNSGSKQWQLMEI